MNIQRGLFRFWVLFALFFGAVIFCISFDSLKDEFERAHTVNEWGDKAVTFVPIECDAARGVEGKDYDKYCKSQYGGIPAGLTNISPPSLETQSTSNNNAPWLDYQNPQSKEKKPSINSLLKKYCGEDLCWYALPKYRNLYPEYKKLNDGDLEDKLYTAVGINHSKPATPWTLLSQIFLIALGIPLGVLITGKLLIWAFAGFRGSTPKKTNNLN